MTKEWFSTGEIAQLLTVGDRRVRERAKQEGWIKQKRSGLGGGFEYHLDSLPEAAKLAIAKQAAHLSLHQPAGMVKVGHAIANVNLPSKSAVDKATSMQQYINLPEKSRTRAEAKSLIIKAKDSFCEPYLQLRKLVQGEKAFCNSYTKKSLPLPAWVYQTITSISMATIRRWEKLIKEQGEHALGGRYQRQQVSLIDTQQELADFLKGLITAKPHLKDKANQLKKLTEIYVYKSGAPWQVPSVSSIRRWVNKWADDNQAAYVFTTNPKKFNDKYRSAVEKMYPWMTAPNDVWEFDSTPVDAMLKEGRHSIIAVIDCFTRRVKLLVSPTSSSEGICLLLRKTLLSWGIPNVGGLMRTDNGSDYVSIRTTSIYHLLDLEQSRANPYSGWEKPFIERFFKTLSHDLIELLPGYIGHNVADRETIEARKEFAVRLKERSQKENQKADFNLRMTQPELQQLLDNWVDAYYHQQPHAGLNKQTPSQAYNATNYVVKPILAPEALDLLLNFAGEAVVLKGFIKINSLRYTAPELLEHHWKGKKVRVFLDPSDVGRAFIYGTNDWETRVEAVDQRLLGREISPDQYRITKREDAKALRSFRKEMNNLAKTFGMDSLHQSVIDHYAAKAKSLVDFPKQETQHNNAAIGALASVAEQLTNPLKPDYSDSQIEHLKQKRQALEARKQAISHQTASLVRNEHDKARLLAADSLKRSLTAKEQGFLKDYMKHNKLGAKRIEEIMGHKRRASN
ncbi:DNA-binding protein [Shewanella sp.]|uniref:DNA-binding protein n=2 Tax=Shewanella sp. TaxID=50422 RepID=UPI0040539386